MSLPIVCIERLFEALALSYGQAFFRRWDDMDMSAVKSDWARVLDGVPLWAIAYALDHLNPDSPPTALQFRALALRCPPKATVRLDMPKADQNRKAAELAKLQHIRTDPKPDPRGWARRLHDKDNADPKSMNPYVRSCYQTALGKGSGK